MGECDCWALGWGWEVMGLCVAHRSEITRKVAEKCENNVQEERAAAPCPEEYAQRWQYYGATN